MRIYANITDRTVRRRFREHQHRARPLTVLDHTLRGFGFQVTADDMRTWFVRVVRKLGPVNIVLGTSADLTAAAAREKAVAAIEAAQAERKTGPLMRVFANGFVRRRAHRWKPATRQSNLYLLRRNILPCFGGMAVAAITRADVQRWFDSLSGTPGAANRAFEILRAMLRAARQWGEFGEHVPDACANIARNPKKAVARYLDEDELAARCRGDCRRQPSEAPRILEVEEMLGLQRSSQRGFTALPAAKECRDGCATELGFNCVQFSSTRQVDHAKTAAQKG